MLHALRRHRDADEKVEEVQKRMAEEDLVIAEGNLNALESQFEEAGITE